MKVTDSGHLDKLRRLVSPEAFSAVALALEGGADEIVDTERYNLNDGAISGPGHVPGAPGDYSKSDTHELEESLHRGETSTVGDTIKTSAEADAAHALFQELGTSTIAARPNMHLATATVRPEIAKRISAALFGVLGSS